MKRTVCEVCIVNGSGSLCVPFGIAARVDRSAEGYLRLRCEHVGGRIAPLCEVRRCCVVLERRFVVVDLAECEERRIVVVLDNVKPHAPGLVPYRTDSVSLGCFDEVIHPVGFDLKPDHQYVHVDLRCDRNGR